MIAFLRIPNRLIPVSSRMVYLNGCGKTSFVALQGIICTFAVRIPVSYFMSKIPNVTLFQVSFATPAASLLGLILCVSYVIYYRKKHKFKFLE